MKKSILLAAAFGFVVVAGTAQAFDNPVGSYKVGPGEGIVGTKHDLSRTTGVGGDYGATDQLDRICIFCHAPHHALKEADAAGIKYLPLWNHAVTSQFYMVYESDFGEGPDDGNSGAASSPDQYLDRHVFNGGDTIEQPGSVSRLCLSCHDGTVAVNEYGFDPQRAYSQGAGGAFIAAQFEIGGGGNLRNHHPIGFDYQDVVDQDDEIAVTATPIGKAGVDGYAKNTSTIGSLLYAGRMECVTCHDVHNTRNTGETFLWRSNKHSAFCLTCHLKGNSDLDAGYSVYDPNQTIQAQGLDSIVEPNADDLGGYDGIIDWKTITIEGGGGTLSNVATVTAPTSQAQQDDNVDTTQNNKFVGPGWEGVVAPNQ